MGIATMIDGVVKWLADKVCNQIKLKVPQTENTATFELCNPSAHGVYAPVIDSAGGGPPQIVAMPMTFRDDFTSDGVDTNVPIYLDVMIWSPGIHENGDVDYSNDGWRDLGNLIDIIRSELKKTGSIDQLHIDTAQPIEYNLYSGIQTVQPEYGDFFRGFVKFSLKTARNSVAEPYRDFL